VVAFQGETGTLGLRDLDRQQVRAELAVDRGVRVIAVDLRDRDRAVVDQVVDPPVLHIHEGHQAVDRMCPRVVCGVVLAEAEAAQKPLAFLIPVLEDAR
jgi:hypothetical protein